VAAIVTKATESDPTSRCGKKVLEKNYAGTNKKSSCIFASYLLPNNMTQFYIFHWFLAFSAFILLVLC